MHTVPHNICSIHNHDPPYYLDSHNKCNNNSFKWTNNKICINTPHSSLNVQTPSNRRNNTHNIMILKWWGPNILCNPKPQYISNNLKCKLQSHNTPPRAPTLTSLQANNNNNNSNNNSHHKIKISSNFHIMYNSSQYAVYRKSSERTSSINYNWFL